ncbi:phage tail protein [Pseudomonas moorei]|nr:phage tail protein [Pseudomonas moorei]
MSITAASATGTLTADEVIVKSALGGNSYRLPSFSKTINLGATGAGGMDIGSSPASGWVALYAIYNPTTGTSALLAKNATAGVQTEVYSGANMPSGYTASALVSVWPTTGAGQLAVGSQFDRVVSTPGVSVLSTSTQQASFTSLSISAAVPPNAKFAAGYMRIGSNSAGDYLGQLSSSASALGTVLIGGGYTNASGYFNLALITAQNIWYAATVTVGTMNASIVISSYTF